MITKNRLIGLLILALVLSIGYKKFKQNKTTLGNTSTNTVTDTQLPTEAPTPTPTPTPTPAIAPNSVLNTTTRPGRGTYFTEPRGFPLYTYDIDTNGSISNCTGICIKNWPPYVSTDNSITLPENVTLVKRADGKMQYAYKSMPLYLHIKDQSPDDMTGDGADDRWHLARPEEQPATNQ